MWRITYKIDHDDLDDDNYGVCRMGDLRYANGETPDEAMQSLIRDIKNDGDLELIIDSCINPSPYRGYKMDIISCEIIAERDTISFYNHPLFLSILGDAKAQADEQKARQKAGMEQRRVEKEKAELERLKKIYG